eukprot:gb/GFBE01037196.1/.p1 GENE.gb/GFBE01037196.1/~~gb/GFBE01037196.1/.p1  ORF type:complete len:228 (+),score=32.22 gb/GFBE01037196.1/:1-684(+)
MARIDYSSTMAFSQQIEKEITAKAVFSQKKGMEVSLTDQPARWLSQGISQTVRPKAAASKQRGGSRLPSCIGSQAPSQDAASGVVEAWLALSPEERQATGLVPVDSADPGLEQTPERPMSRSSSSLSHSRSSPLLWSAGNALAGGVSCALRDSPKSCNRKRAPIAQEQWLWGGLGAETGGEGSPRKSAVELPKRAASAASSSRPEFWQSGLRRSNAFSKAVRGSWAP